ncbi:MAG TPA: GNAT family N-acetyltransferase [Burkholderiales bacterium]|nr:GNAT family N-acetyltransferase [Burkholderiales bacterium]
MPEVTGRYSVRAAAGPVDFAAARALFLEYAAWLQEDLCFQGFEEELATLPGRYAPPDGRLFLACRDDTAIGCVALRRFDAESGEVKRLYVEPGDRGHGVAHALTAAVIQAAREIGYRRLVLDTLDRMTAARQLYAGAGFREIPAYYETPICGTRFMELMLREMEE